MSVTQSGSYEHARIMIVDDDLITLEVIQALLAGDGYKNFVTTTRSTEALSLIEAQRPDVLLLDLLMPDLSGFDVLRMLNDAGHLTGLPVIMLTAQSDSQTKLEALELGAIELLSKPVDPSELRLRLRNALGTRHHGGASNAAGGSNGAQHGEPAGVQTSALLPGRAVFEQEVNWALRRAGYKGQVLALLNLSFAEMASLRETLTTDDLSALHQACRAMLQAALDATLAGQQPEDGGFQATLASADDDEFMLLLDDLADLEVAARVARSIINSFSEPLQLGERSIRLHVSIGVAAYPVDADRADKLLAHAGAALAKARRIPGAALRFHSNEMDARSAARLAEELELALAIVEGAFVLHYQPRMNMLTGEFTEFEALIRWQHPERGLLSPGEFMPAAQSSGLMGAIEDWVLLEASRQGALWRSRYGAPACVSVNLSSKQVRRPDLTRAVRRILHQSGLQAEHLRLEFAALDVMNDPVFDLKSLDELQALGVRLSIDHFGRGAFSLSELERMPVDEIKIDRSFFGESNASSKDSAIVRAIISIAHDLGLRVVAVGVESERQLEFLRAHGCDDCKGFFVSAPMSAEQVSQYLATHDKGQAAGGGKVVDMLRA
ncbi:MAG: EAL domain-containing protein [Gammaproteobacteria bacterium]|nr:EAL domain-containing protein [Gammaproteobacteria bacterium]